MLRFTPDAAPPERAPPLARPRATEGPDASETPAGPSTGVTPVPSGMPLRHRSPRPRVGRRGPAAAHSRAGEIEKPAV